LSFACIDNAAFPKRRRRFGCGTIADGTELLLVKHEAEQVYALSIGVLLHGDKPNEATSLQSLFLDGSAAARFGSFGDPPSARARSTNRSAAARDKPRSMRSLTTAAGGTPSRNCRRTAPDKPSESVHIVAALARSPSRPHTESARAEAQFSRRWLTAPRHPRAAWRTLFP
jgi:hypothetical protein